jgi:mitosis inhibitor protein kinase SWE1
VVPGLVARSHSGTELTIFRCLRTVSDWRLPPPPVPAFSPAPVRQAPSILRSGSSTSTSSGTVTACLNSPTEQPQQEQRNSRIVERGHARRQSCHAGPGRSRSTHPPLRVPTAEERPGKFDRDFVEIDDLGSGEFGKASKVRYRNSADARVFAVKRSRTFEGIKHRLVSPVVTFADSAREYAVSYPSPCHPPVPVRIRWRRSR